MDEDNCGCQVRIVGRVRPWHRRVRGHRSKAGFWHCQKTVARAGKDACIRACPVLALSAVSRPAPRPSDWRRCSTRNSLCRPMAVSCCRLKFDSGELKVGRAKVSCHEQYGRSRSLKTKREMIRSAKMLAVRLEVPLLYLQNQVFSMGKFGYQAHPFRHLALRKRSPDSAAAGFFRYFRELCRRG